VAAAIAAATETVKKFFDSLKTPNFLQNRIFAKNVAMLPAALENQGLQRLFI
jgi:hypothetical protein